LQKVSSWHVSRFLYFIKSRDHLSCSHVTTRIIRDLPETYNWRATIPFPIRSCSRWGLPCHQCHHWRGELLPPRSRLCLNRGPDKSGRLFTLTPIKSRRYIFCGTFPRSPGAVVNGHLALSHIATGPEFGLSSPYKCKERSPNQLEIFKERFLVFGLRNRIKLPTYNTIFFHNFHTQQLPEIFLNR